MSRTPDNHRETLIGRDNQILQRARRIWTGLETKIGCRARHPRLTASQPIVTIPDPHTLLFLQHIGGDIVTSIPVQPFLQRDARTRTIRPDLILVIAVILIAHSRIHAHDTSAGAIRNRLETGLEISSIRL